ncbi:hypothetical protein KP509_14G007000 [Ceratopteris richardii]|uniref:tRNA pseudouridine synthase n=1 Tax=Ceratopteris richardii TaxID=49495 RepID=A0A8T2T5F3_CERRI|nr:hypothetical protein KP509_14G007000 [Ceratopteris richardii]
MKHFTFDSYRRTFHSDSRMQLLRARTYVQLAVRSRRRFSAHCIESAMSEHDGAPLSTDSFNVKSKEASWVHYRHEDGLDDYRWTTKECHRILEDRPWEEVLKFYARVAAGKLSLSDLNFYWNSDYADSVETACLKDLAASIDVPRELEDSSIPSKVLKGGKWDRRTFKILLAYDGSAFMGWQKQNGLHTIQGLLEQALGKFCDGKRITSLKSEGFDVDAAVVVAGRTDRGVHAVGQVCSFYTWRSDVCSDDVREHINLLEPKALRAISVDEVPRTFHPNFSAKWRHYLYILPLQDNYLHDTCEVESQNADSKNVVKPKMIDASSINEMLSYLEGKQLSFTIFARDTKASRSRGPPTECFIYHARAAIAELPNMEQGSKQRSQVLCIELVANRFLRKMVRVLVATSIREAAAGASHDILVRLTEASCRRASAPPAPACGLCLTERGTVEY